MLVLSVKTCCGLAFTMIVMQRCDTHLNFDTLLHACSSGSGEDSGKSGAAHGSELLHVRCRPVDLVV